MTCQLAVGLLKIFKVTSNKTFNFSVMEQYDITGKTSFFTLRYPAIIRIWHWLTFLFFAASMTTVLFASTVFNIKRNHPDNREHQMQVNQKQIKGPEEPHRFDPSKLDPETRAAFTLKNKIWDAHKIIGFGLCFLLVSRLIIEITQNREQRIGQRIRNALSIPIQGKEAQLEKKHFILVKRGYQVFYLLFTLMAITGLIMAFEHTPVLEAVQRPSREVHQFVQYLIYGYIVFHLTGVIRADLTKQKGIVSAMINGGSNQVLQTAEMK